MNAKSEIISIVKNAFAGYGIGEHCKKYGGKDHRGYDTIVNYPRLKSRACKKDSAMY